MGAFDEFRAKSEEELRGGRTLKCQLGRSKRRRKDNINMILEIG
jgi:hypothetical protein